MSPSIPSQRPKEEEEEEIGVVLLSGTEYHGENREGGVGNKKKRIRDYIRMRESGRKKERKKDKKKGGGGLLLFGTNSLLVGFTTVAMKMMND